MLRVNQLIGFGVGGAPAPTPTQPLWNPSDADPNAVFSDGDRRFYIPAPEVGSVRSTVAVDDGVGRYIELSNLQNSGNASWRFGLATGAASITGIPGASGHASWVIRGSDGNYVHNGSTVGTSWPFSQPGAQFMMCFKAGSVWFGEAGSWDGDPEAGTGAAFTGLTGPLYIIGGRSTAASGDRGATFEVLGSYSYSPPAGFLAGW